MMSSLTSANHGGDVDPDGHDGIWIGLDVDSEGKLDARLLVEVNTGGLDGLN